MAKFVELTNNIRVINVYVELFLSGNSATSKLLLYQFLLLNR